MNINSTPINFKGFCIKADRNGTVIEGKPFDNDKEIIDLLRNKIENNGVIKNPVFQKRNIAKNPEKVSFTLNDRFEISAKSLEDDPSYKTLSIRTVDSDQNNYYMTIGADRTETQKDLSLKVKLSVFVDFLFAKAAQAFVDNEANPPVDDEKTANNTVIDLLK